MSTTFVAAVAAGEVETVRNMLDDDPQLLAGAGPDGASLALTALYSGHKQLADELAARAGTLSVFEAAAFDDTDRLEKLITAELAIAQAWSPDGWQPLHLAARFGRTEAARALLDADAPVDEPSRNTEVSLPLHAAAAGGHGELVWLLVASDASVQARRQDGSTALHLAVAAGDLVSVQALLSVGADPEAVDGLGRRPVELAGEPAVLAALRNGQPDEM